MDATICHRPNRPGGPAVALLSRPVQLSPGALEVAGAGYRRRLQCGQAGRWPVGSGAGLRECRSNQARASRAFALAASRWLRRISVALGHKPMQIMPCAWQRRTWQLYGVAPIGILPL